MTSHAAALAPKSFLHRPLRAIASLLSLRYFALRASTAGAAIASGLVQTFVLARVLDPSFNRYRLETLNLGVHAPLSRALHHASYTFLKKLSHTADSQDQRHRMVPGSRPLMTLTDTRRPDFVTPPLIAANPRARSARLRSAIRTEAAAWPRGRQELSFPRLGA